jgi:hypothetical protein
MRNVSCDAGAARKFVHEMLHKRWMLDLYMPETGCDLRGTMEHTVGKPFWDAVGPNIEGYKRALHRAIDPGAACRSEHRCLIPTPAPSLTHETFWLGETTN